MEYTERDPRDKPSGAHYVERPEHAHIGPDQGEASARDQTNDVGTRIQETGDRLGEWERATSKEAHDPRTREGAARIAKWAGIALAAFGAFLLILWFIASISAQVVWPGSLFVWGLVFIVVAALLVYGVRRMAPAGGRGRMPGGGAA